MVPARKRRAPLTKPKTPRELANLKKSIEVTRRIFSELDSPFGRSEADVAHEIRMRAKRLGAGLAFQPIVASGANSGCVHHKAGRKIVRDYEPVIFDVGFKVGCQCTDVTRMHIPNRNKYKRFFNDCVAMQKRCIDASKPGKTLKEVNLLWKRMMRKRGYRMKHGIGHGVGRHVHERAGILKPGMVITVEPGIYERKGGCRVEDMVLITRSKPKILTKKINLIPFP